MPKPHLKRWQSLEHAYAKHLSRLLTRIQVNGPPMRLSMDPPSRKKKLAPPLFITPPLFERRNMARAIDMGWGYALFLQCECTSRHIVPHH